MVFAGTAFGGDEVIVFAVLQDVRPLDPARLLRDVGAAVDDLDALADQFQVFVIEFLHPNGAMAAVARRFVGLAVVDEIGLVAVPKQRRIDAVERKPYRIGPRPGRVLGGDDEIAPAAHAGIDDVIQAVVIGNVRRVNAVGYLAAGKIELPRPVDGIGDLRPTDQIPRMENRQAGEMGKGRIDQIIVLVDPKDRRVGVIPRQNRVAVLFFARLRRFLRPTGIGKPLEPDGAGDGRDRTDTKSGTQQDEAGQGSGNDAFHAFLSP